MATYTVNISGTFNQTYGYLTINGTKITTAGTRTYSSKPTIKAFVSSSQSNLRSKCYVSHNGTVLKSGYGEYTLSIDAETMDIKMLQVQDPSTYLYYAVEITTKVPSEPHNTNISGTAREIESGTVLIGGVLREIESGMTLVGGVAREIVLAKEVKTVSVAITGNGYMYNKIYASATINGSVYYSSITLDVPEGTEITLTVMSTFGSLYKATIYINGELVVSVSEDTGTYAITVNTNMTIALSTRDDRETGSISVTY